MSLVSQHVKTYTKQISVEADGEDISFAGISDEQIGMPHDVVT